MSKREWKPGDLAMSGDGRVMRVEFAYGKGAGWVYDDGSGAPGNYPGNLRPLVVIDPEDREAVERLWVVLRDGLALRSRDNLTAALREFANPKPPKPEEPTGLGAVVEDAGAVWVRTETDEAGWCPSGSGPYRCWADFSPAVRVLSPGVEVAS